MKKILSLLLAGLMTASVFAVGASADDEVAKKATPVGETGGVTDIADNTRGSSDINVKVDKVTHMYAVDITYSFADVSLGDLKWDVNNLKYVQDDAKNAKKAADTTRSLTISNRSDMPVNAAVCVDDTKRDDSLEMTIKTADFQDETVMIAKVDTSASKVEATKVTVEFDVKPVTNSTWDDVIAYYGPSFAHPAANEEGGSIPEITTVKFVFATVTVTLSEAS